MGPRRWERGEPWELEELKKWTKAVGMLSCFRITPPEFQEGRRVMKDHIQYSAGCQRITRSPFRAHEALRTDNLQAEGGVRIHRGLGRFSDVKTKSSSRCKMLRHRARVAMPAGPEVRTCWNLSRPIVVIPSGRCAATQGPPALRDVLGGPGQEEQEGNLGRCTNSFHSPINSGAREHHNPARAHRTEGAAEAGPMASCSSALPFRSGLGTPS